MADQISELHGDLVSMDFIEGGRISQLWVSDPDLPEEREEFQFCMGSLNFNGENAEDYLPGTFMLGVRGHESEPWVLARNEVAEILEEEDHFGEVGFECDLALIPDMRVESKFIAKRGDVPHVLWQLSVRNESIRPLEIGELAFPLALNNFYEGFGPSDDEMSRLYHSRVYLHKAISGGASYLFAQRLIGTGPGLLIYPGRDTSWEFYHHVQSSLRTPWQWEGIPVVYVHSKAAIEREGWQEWANGHSSRILKPGETAIFETCFAPVVTAGGDRLSQALMAAGKPGFRLFPAAVAPYDVGISIEVGGAGPLEFECSPPVEFESDTDEAGGFLLLKPTGPIETRVSVSAGGPKSFVHLAFVDKIDRLIRSRASFISSNQIADDAICSFDSAGGRLFADPMEGGLSDALFLAQKNAVYPEREQVSQLDAHIDKFLLTRLQNPADLSVGATLNEGSGFNFGRALLYPQVAATYHAMYRIASAYGETARSPEEYLQLSLGTVLAMFRHSWHGFTKDAGIPGFEFIYDILNDATLANIPESDECRVLITSRAERVIARRYPCVTESLFDTAGFEDAFYAAKFLGNDEMQFKCLERAMAARSLAPSWWWYGSDKRFWDASPPTEEMEDCGEACHSYPTALNSSTFFSLLDRDYPVLPEAYVRKAFGGLLGAWALVNADGSGGQCYCPDAASAHFGRCTHTGDIGLTLSAYLRSVASYVLPSRNGNFLTFGCTYEFVDGVHRVVPWDGVGQRIVLRQFGFEISTTFGCISLLELDAGKKWFGVSIENPSDKRSMSRITIKGMWGNRISVFDKTVQGMKGEVTFEVPLAPYTAASFRADVE